MQNLPSEFHPLISDALESYASGNEMKIEEEKAHIFTDYMLQKIQKNHISIIE
ncbi:MAG: hypothetical protein HDQ97_13230 [Lachnospiraceae bacterium]|nr:hypothetical protein [Lachnospiraceae bacterium]